mmetsp:Transcript_14177/g.48796  ORF Transcript_14177/g.48796 Transcript_14177/m.48796 type:complete len:275 (+) Transcript_14177:288-1112(+)
MDRHSRDDRSPAARSRCRLRISRFRGSSPAALGGLPPQSAGDASLPGDSAADSSGADAQRGDGVPRSGVCTGMVSLRCSGTKPSDALFTAALNAARSIAAWSPPPSRCRSDAAGRGDPSGDSKRNAPRALPKSSAGAASPSSASTSRRASLGDSPGPHVLKRTRGGAEFDRSTKRGSGGGVFTGVDLWSADRRFPVGLTGMGLITPGRPTTVSEGLPHGGAALGLLRAAVMCLVGLVESRRRITGRGPPSSTRMQFCDRATLSRLPIGIPLGLQ